MDIDNEFKNALHRSKPALQQQWSGDDLVFPRNCIFT